jgi:hypothetical protein
MRHLLIALSFLVVLSARAADKPNILFIFSDDHAQHAISAYGSKVNTTPHLDRLAKEGVRFANSFVANSICTPSRAAATRPGSTAGSSCPARARIGIHSSSSWAGAN